VRAGTRTRRRSPLPASAASLEEAALGYLQRFSSSSAQLRRVLLRRVARASRGNTQEGARLVEAMIARYLQAGLLDDSAYAAQQAASLRRRGASRHAIRSKLTLRGVDAAVIEETLQRLDQEEAEGELVAACALLRRRRLGPYRPKSARAAHRLQDLAALDRAGFSLELARRVLAAADPEALEALARGSAAPPPRVTSAR
jgi:regulatory protein